MRNITDDIPKAVENTFYTAVGLGVLGLQRIQVHRQELKRSLSPLLGEARVALDDGLKTVEERLIDLDDRFDEAFESLEPLLPEAARGPARQAVAFARDARHQIFELVECQDGDDPTIE
jgi:3-methyladenine DNA glycosylase/8-oxoguanine DNA glycosylase